MMKFILHVGQFLLYNPVQQGFLMVACSLAEVGATNFKAKIVNERNKNRYCLFNYSSSKIFTNSSRAGLCRSSPCRCPSLTSLENVSSGLLDGIPGKITLLLSLFWLCSVVDITHHCASTNMQETHLIPFTLNFLFLYGTCACTVTTGFRRGLWTPGCTLYVQCVDCL